MENKSLALFIRVLTGMATIDYIMESTECLSLLEKGTISKAVFKYNSCKNFFIYCIYDI